MLQTITLNSNEETATVVEVALTSEMHAIMDSSTVVHGEGPDPELVEQSFHRHVYRISPAPDAAYTFMTKVSGGDCDYKIGQNVVCKANGEQLFEKSVKCDTKRAHNYDRIASSGLHFY